MKRIAACMMMLNMEIGINNQQEEIVTLENQIEEINNAKDAIRSAWGRDVTIADDGRLSLN